MKDKYETQIKLLTAENETLKKENLEYPPKVSELESQSKDWQTKYEAKCKEIEKLLADLKKQEKMYENRIAGINSKSHPFNFLNFRKQFWSI